MVADRMSRIALSVFGNLPRPVRRFLIHSGTRTFTVGCLAVITRSDSREILLLDQPHHSESSLPGGLINRGEAPTDCVRREVREELGVDVTFATQPDGVVVEHAARRVDLVFLHEDTGESYHPTSPEVRRIRWVSWESVDAASPAGQAIAAALGGD